MSYDYDGYDDGSVDLKKLIKETFKEIGQEGLQMQQQENARRMQQDANEVIRGYCEANGISQQEWNEMASNPEITREAYLKGVRDYAQRVTQRARDPKTGQFVKSTPQPQNLAPGSDYIPDNKVTQRMNPAPQERRGTTQEVINQLDRILG